MVPIRISIFLIICLMVKTWAIESSIENDDQNNWGEDLEAEFQARLLEDKKREHINGGGKRGSDEPSINLDNEVLENRITDCEKRREIIVMGDDSTGTGVCYLHQMNDEYYQALCLGTGQVNQVYSIKVEITNKDFLSQNGPDSVCRNRPMYFITFVKDLDPNATEKPKKGKFLNVYLIW
ncbi:hypothetical protein CHS0354_000122 [Potamilus streckersoni]|uniref:Secreted protein n=1 Tax=Potamilus streckersoni TaxID=2493646 RepID=A0AAE0RY89_9BIVA|nr:hypothetical protein CHS0354_000122 [Potamilus streckersoni]